MPDSAALASLAWHPDAAAFDARSHHALQKFSRFDSYALELDQFFGNVGSSWYSENCLAKSRILKQTENSL